MHKQWLQQQHLEQQQPRHRTSSTASAPGISTGSVNEIGIGIWIDSEDATAAGEDRTHSTDKNKPQQQPSYSNANRSMTSSHAHAIIRHTMMQLDVTGTAILPATNNPNRASAEPGAKTDSRFEPPLMPMQKQMPHRYSHYP